MADVVKLPLSGTNIPDDILIDILFRLPVRSLLFFRLVSRSWLNLIQNPNFIKLHNSRPDDHDDRVNPMLIMRNIEKIRVILNRKVSLTLLSDDDTWAYDDCVPLELVSPNTDWMSPGWVILLGPCNGLFCRIDLAEVLVFNPATRRCRKIYPSISQSSVYSRYVGFGFDHVSNDYKVVMVDGSVHNKSNSDTNDDNGGDNDALCYVKVDVFSSSADSWRQVECVVPASGIMLQSHTYSSFINSGFHWLNDSDDPFILVFDLNVESIKQFKLPDSSIEDFLDLLILNESLSLIVNLKNSTNYCEYNTFEIWAMKEYGVYESWSKLYKIPPVANFDRPLSFGKDGELLLQTKDGKLVSYNLNNRSIKEFHIPGVPQSMSAFRYKETLISLKQRKQERVSFREQ